MQSIYFFTACNPVAQPRQRHRIIPGKGNNKGFVSNFTPARHPVQAFKRELQIEARKAMKDQPAFDCPLEVEIVIVYDRIQTQTEKKFGIRQIPKATKPDADNVAKAVMDALNGVVWSDDSRIFSLLARKYYAAIGEVSGVHISVVGESTLAKHERE
jgi:Holliday junction resolvase RusA-like endonuclease